MSTSPALQIKESFEAYSDDFLKITARGKPRFEQRQWLEVLADAEERLGLYHKHLDGIEAILRPGLGGGGALGGVSLAGKVEREGVLASWEQWKAEYLGFFDGDYRADLALIYFYSVMRRMLLREGRSVEYSDDEIRRALKAQVAQDPTRPVRVYPADGPGDINQDLLERIVRDYSFEAPFEDLARDCALAAEMLREEAVCGLGRHRIDRIEFLQAAFYRNKAAYLMGRVVAGSVICPMVLVLLHREQGIVIDSALSQEEDLSSVFTSARSNFHVVTTGYREMVEFLESIAPSRPKTYIYTSIGFIHPGKLQLVHELRRFLQGGGGRFQVAEGVPGTVMMVFTLPGFRYVFKVIRDASSKESFRGHSHVVGQYWRVHRMDRVGRMLDILTFHNLRFSKEDFEPGLLEELLREAPASVREEGGQIVFRYLYASRQITPLDVFLKDPAIAEEAKARAVVDYGNAIKDLAAAGTFVGDYLPKNFGVARMGRVILYDYDDLDELVRYNFRHLPETPWWAESLPYEDWVSKGPLDVFPEYDFRIFTVPARMSGVFLEHHSDVLAPEFWNGIKAELLARRVPEFFPYPQSKRLRNYHPRNSESMAVTDNRSCLPQGAQ